MFCISFFVVQAQAQTETESLPKKPNKHSCHL